MLDIRFVAGIAFCVEVLACKGKVGGIVVEGALVQLHDVGIAPLVIGVAARTVRVQCMRILAVVAATRVDVRCDVFMAIQAERPLVRSPESQVTVAALRFVLGVTFDDVARHHQCLDLGDCIRCSKTHRHQRKSDRKESLAHITTPRLLVHVYGEHVDQRRKDHHKKDRQV